MFLVIGKVLLVFDLDALLAFACLLELGVGEWQSRRPVLALELLLALEPLLPFDPLLAFAFLLPNPALAAVVFSNAELVVELLPATVELLPAVLLVRLA
jgi:hypothetical protein